MKAISRHLASHGWLFAKTQRAIDLLQVGWTALISAAVPGQIDVRDAGARTDSRIRH